MSENSNSIAARFREAVSLVQSNPEEAVATLTEIQTNVSAMGLFSSNETMEDVSTPSIALLSLDYHLAMAYASIRTIEAKQRKKNLTCAMNHYSRFLEQLGQLDILPDDRKKELDELLQTNMDDDVQHSGSASRKSTFHQINRDEKIQRYRYKQDVQQQLDQLLSIKNRRSRLGIQDHEEMDGYDDDMLERSLAIQNLVLYSIDAMDEWHQAIREMPMIDMRIRMEEGQGIDPRRDSTNATASSIEQSNQGLKLTHITQDNMTGQLNIRKEEIRSQVFRPGWNQPTMSLEELGDMEVRDAMARAERQKLVEDQQQHEPRRYDQLVKDGMEDNADLVDASALLDRKWDDWKAENPKGSGNKMGDRGDRNF